MVSQEDYYLKAPGLTDLLYSELGVCVLRRHPYPNIATSYGCREENGSSD